MDLSELKIEYLSTEDLIAYDRNARVHGEDQIVAIMDSMREFGFTNPVLIDGDGVLIAGHGRLEAATRLGLEHVPAIRLKGLSDRQVKALRIADNQLQLHKDASWDLDLLAMELEDLTDDDFDIEVLGFEDDFLDDLLKDGSDLIEDGYPQPMHEDVGRADVMVAVGPYRIQVNRIQWDTWEMSIRSEVGMLKTDIEKEILRRLRLK